MKEATGSSAMLYILLVFLAVYVMFIAIAVNYARAFKTKNKIIDIIEQNQGIDLKNNSDSTVVAINSYLREINYNINYNISDIDNKYTGCNNDLNNIDNESEIKCKCYDNGYCIAKNKGIKNDMYYYKVTTFIILKVPLIDSLTFTIPVMGETIEMDEIS